jgi:uncharacterized protein YjiS (DUF1127 family)
MDINFCLEFMGLSHNEYRLSSGAPPHTIADWRSDERQPTYQEMEVAWIEFTKVNAWKQLREQRNRLLQSSDFSQLPDAPVNRDEWATYRQALRDLPANTNDVFNPVYPEKP